MPNVCIYYQINMIWAKRMVCYLAFQYSEGHCCPCSGWIGGSTINSLVHCKKTESKDTAIQTCWQLRYILTKWTKGSVCSPSFWMLVQMWMTNSCLLCSCGNILVSVWLWERARIPHRENTISDIWQVNINKKHIAIQSFNYLGGVDGWSRRLMVQVSDVHCTLDGS